MKDKVGIYCRLSDEDRYKKDKSDDSESIANQKSMLLKYAYIAMIIGQEQILIDRNFKN